MPAIYLYAMALSRARNRIKRKTLNPAKGSKIVQFLLSELHMIEPNFSEDTFTMPELNTVERASLEGNIRQFFSTFTAANASVDIRKFGEKALGTRPRDNNSDQVEILENSQNGEVESENDGDSQTENSPEHYCPPHPNMETPELDENPDLDENIDVVEAVEEEEVIWVTEEEQICGHNLDVYNSIRNRILSSVDLFESTVEEILEVFEENFHDDCDDCDNVAEQPTFWRPWL